MRLRISGRGSTASAANPAVFVFSLVPTPFQHGSLGVVRSLGRLGLAVHGNYPFRWAPVRASRHAAAGVLWRPWPRSAEEAIERLLEWSADRSDRVVLIPVDDAAAVAVAEYAPRLEHRFLFPRQDASLAGELSNKLRLARRCETLDVPAPRTLRAPTHDDVDAAAAELGFPMLLKRVANRSRADYDTPSVRVVAGRRELELLAHELETQGGQANHLLQELVPGGPGRTWIFNGYFDDSSRCLVSYTGVKLRDYPSGRGPVTLGECRRNDTVADLAVHLLSALGYRGPVDIDFRLDERDGQYKLLDVNPRIGASFRLFVAPSGTDVVRALYLDLTGKPVPGDRPVDGRRWLVEPLDVRRSLLDPRNLHRWPGSLRGVQELAWFAADDPLPAAALAACVVGRSAARLRGSGVPIQPGARPESR